MLKFFTTPSGVLFVMMNGIKMKVRISTKVKGYKYVMGKTILATVVCTQLGFSGGKVTHNSMFGKTKRKFWMDSLFCTGNEKFYQNASLEALEKLTARIVNPLELYANQNYKNYPRNGWPIIKCKNFLYTQMMKWKSDLQEADQ